VILTTCNEGLIPHQKAQVEEERRLFYVAMTRASSNLVISYVKSACGTDVPPSRFLYEAGLIEKPGQKRKGGPAVPSPNGYVALAKSRVFHRPECRAVKDMEARLTKFATRDEAVQVGKKPCEQCKP
jgi:ATP-dependent exoDNAse (exonuclease V) beta subunit